MTKEKKIAAANQAFEVTAARQPNANWALVVNDGDYLSMEGQPDEGGNLFAAIGIKLNDSGCVLSCPDISVTCIQEELHSEGYDAEGYMMTFTLAMRAAQLFTNSYKRALLSK